MAALDRTKEELAYSRFWQGVVVITDISLIGWSFASFSSAPVLTFTLAITGVLFLTMALAFDRYIRRGINELGRL